MKCPHCLHAFHEQMFGASLDPIIQARHPNAVLSDGLWTPTSVTFTQCPGCHKWTIFLGQQNEGNPRMVWPKGVARSPLPPEVPAEYAEDYREACLVLADSPKASAALSRRCLQHLIRTKAGISRRDLATEIDDLIKTNTLPSDLAQAVDAIRNIGNFAAHPIKSQHTGDIVEVELGEAEWTLDVLEALFDFYFVRPAQLAARRAALDAKLASAGKPPMK